MRQFFQNNKMFHFLEKRSPISVSSSLSGEGEDDTACCIGQSTLVTVYVFRPTIYNKMYNIQIIYILYNIMIKKLVKMFMMNEEEENTPRRNHNRENLHQDLQKWDLAAKSEANIFIRKFWISIKSIVSVIITWSAKKALLNPLDEAKKA